MPPQDYYCSKCGSSVEADCDFCPNCGEPKLRTNQGYQSPSSAHPWMQDPPPKPPPQPQQRAGNAPPPYYQPQSGSGSLSYSPPLSPAPQIVYHQVISAPMEQGGGTLSSVGMTMGIVAACLMVVGLVPCLGWLNWFTIPFASITDIVSFVAVLTEGRRFVGARSKALIGLILASIVTFVCIIRLAIGGGCF